MTIIRSIALFAAAVWSQVACGQLVLQDQYAQHSPIVIRCEVPSVPLTTVTLLWSVDESAYSIPCPAKSGVDDLHVWAPPGEHWVEATIISNRYREQTIRIPDPDEPTNPAKFKIDTVRIQVGTDAQRYKKKFTVSGVPVPTPPKPIPPIPIPQPPPIPNPPVPTPPTDEDIEGLFGLCPKVRDRVLLMPGVTSEQITGLAANYQSVATLLAERKLAAGEVGAKLAELNGATLATDADLKTWKLFWPWLGREMQALDKAGRFLARNAQGVALRDANGETYNDPDRIMVALAEIHCGFMRVEDKR